MSKDNRAALDITVETVGANGTYRLEPNDPDPGNRPHAINWRTKLGEGFSDGGYSVNRPVDEDYHDLNLVDTTRFIDADGNILYEGYQAGQPRDLDSMHSIGVALAGPVVNAKRRKFREVYVDRVSSRWVDMATSEKVRLVTAAVSIGDFSWTTDGAALVCALPNQALGTKTAAETWYLAPPGVTIAKAMYKGIRTTWPASWQAPAVAFTPQADLTASVESVAATLDDTLRTLTPVTPRRYVSITAYSNNIASTPAAGANERWTKIGLYGSHGLTTYAPLTVGEPEGVRLTDAFTNIITRFCPGLDASGIQTSTYVVPQLAYAERTWPYDALLDLNKYLLWKLCVWEAGRVQYEPHDLTDYTWQIRTDDPNVTFSWVGPTTENLANGVAVTYTDLLTGRREELTPETNAALADSDPDNPFTLAGVNQWYEIDLSTPQLADGAVGMALAALAEYNRPKAPGTFTIRGHIRDRQGNWQPAAQVRAGDTIAITNHPNDAPRLIVETDYQHDPQQQLRVSVDAPFNLIEAQMDRLNVELESLGLSG